MDFDAYHNADSAGIITLTKELLLTAAKRIIAKVDFEYDSFKNDLRKMIWKVCPHLWLGDSNIE